MRSEEDEPALSYALPRPVLAVNNDKPAVLLTMDTPKSTQLEESSSSYPSATQLLAVPSLRADVAFEPAQAVRLETTPLIASLPRKTLTLAEALTEAKELTTVNDLIVQDWFNAAFSASSQLFSGDSNEILPHPSTQSISVGQRQTKTGFQPKY